MFISTRRTFTARLYIGQIICFAHRYYKYSGRFSFFFFRAMLYAQRVARVSRKRRKSMRLSTFRTYILISSELPPTKARKKAREYTKHDREIWYVLGMNFYTLIWIQNEYFPCNFHLLEEISLCLMDVICIKMGYC